MRHRDEAVVHETICAQVEVVQDSLWVPSCHQVMFQRFVEEGSDCRSQVIEQLFGHDRKPILIGIVGVGAEEVVALLLEEFGTSYGLLDHHRWYHWLAVLLAEK